MRATLAGVGLGLAGDGQGQDGGDAGLVLAASGDVHGQRTKRDSKG